MARTTPTIPRLAPLIVLAMLLPLAGAQDGGAALLPGSQRIVLAPGEESLAYVTFGSANETEARFTFVVASRSPVDMHANATEALAITVSPGSARVAAGGSATIEVRLALSPDAPALAEWDVILIATTDAGASPDPARIEVRPAAGETSTRTESAAARAPAVPGAALALAATGAGAVSLAWVARRREGLLFLLAPLYSRLARPTLLDQETRQRVLDAVRAEPGAHLAQLRRATGLGSGALVHHVRLLERHGFVRTRRVGHLRRIDPIEAPPPSGPALTPAEARVLAALRDGPATQAELAARLGVSQQAVSARLRGLVEAGHARVEREAGALRYRAGSR